MIKRWKICTGQPRKPNCRETGKPNVSIAPRDWKKFQNASLAMRKFVSGKYRSSRVCGGAAGAGPGAGAGDGAGVVPTGGMPVTEAMPTVERDCTTGLGLGPCCNSTFCAVQSG